MIPTKFFVDTATRIRVPVDVNGRQTGNAEYLEFKCRFQEKKTVVRNANGEDLDASHKIFCASDTDITEGDRIVYGSLNAGTLPAKYRTVITSMLKKTLGDHHREVLVY